jgi:hypothetical protein
VVGTEKVKQWWLGRNRKGMGGGERKCKVRWIKEKMDGSGGYLRR